MRFVLQQGLAALALVACAQAWSTGQEKRDPGEVAAEAVAQEAGFQEAAAPGKAKPFLFEPGPGLPSVVVPREEKLVYRAYLNFSVVTSHVGTVTETCTVTPLQTPLVVAQPTASSGEVASIKLDAAGSYLWYDLKSTLETRIFPQDWPRLSYQSVSDSGTKRKREMLVGKKDGKWMASYRGDTDKGVPKGSPRIWRAEQVRTVPEGTLDMLTAVFMARALVQEGKDSLTFPLIDKTRLWKLVLKRGDERHIETGAGVFDALEIVLEPSPYEGEDFGKKANQFEGVFGIQGSMHLWVDKKTGTAVRIQGVLPINDGMIKLGIDVVLDSFSGTAPEFAPVASEKKKK